MLMVNEANFENEVLKSDVPVLLDFFTTWCGPCGMLSPIIEEIAKENPDIKVCKIDVDQSTALASRFGIVSIPTLIVMKNGRITAQNVGYIPKEKILSML